MAFTCRIGTLLGRALLGKKQVQCPTLARAMNITSGLLLGEFLREGPISATDRQRPRNTNALGGNCVMRHASM